MKIVVLGGGGFIGAAIVDRLLQAGHQIRVLERPRVVPYRVFAAKEEVEWVTGDLLSMHDMQSAITGMEVVVHLVSTTLPKSANEDPVYDVQTNLVASLQLLDAMVAQQIKKIVFISSGGTVYGAPKYIPMDEQHPTEPRLSYGITKLAIEKFLLMYQDLHGIKANILRVTNPYGERQRIETAQGAVGVFLSRALTGKTIDIWGDGSVTRDYVYVQDVADAFAQAVLYDGGQSVFNISTGIGTSLRELIQIIEGVLGHKIGQEFYPARGFDIPVSILDNSLAKTELDWHPKIALKEGIVRTVEWMRKNQVQHTAYT